MWEERALRARRDLTAMAAAGAGVGELHAAAVALVDRTVGVDLVCCASIDPETLVISSMVSGEARIAPPYEPLLAAAEYSPLEPHRYSALALRGQPVARSSELPVHERARSMRFNEVWRPLGVDRELRVLFLADGGACWGAMGMVRTGHDFADREVELLAAVAPAVAAATRLAVRSQTRGGSAGPPSVAVVDVRGALCSATPAAREWQQRLDETAPGRFGVMMRVMAAGALAHPSGGFRARLPDRRGGWAVLEASPLVGGDDAQVAVTIEPAAGEQLFGLLLLAYALTARESEVCREVVAGRSTAEIAERLHISANTVQDHLKSVFAKVAVRSRGELVARLRPEVQLS